MPHKTPSGTIKTKIYKELHRSIILGARRPGERVDIASIAESYGTSITPVREALQMLGQDGLVTTEPHSGYFVSRINLKQLDELLDLRRILETAAVERAAVEATEEQFQQLESVHSNHTAGAYQSIDQAVDENHRFHDLIGEASGNSELAKTLSQVHNRLARFLVIRGSIETMASTHARTIEALRKRDPAAARKAVLDEISAAREAVIDHVLREDGPFWYLGERSTHSQG